MIFIAILFILLFAGLLVAVFTLGFQVGGENWQRRLLAVRMEAAEAQRAMHNLTRQAFVAMAEEVERRRRP